MGFTVAITGPTGDIGRSLLQRLDKAPEVDRIIGMARRPFDPAELGLEKTEYRQGDILDKDSISTLVEDADVLVHLAFVIIGSHDETRRVNLEGTRNVFEAAVSGGVKRFVYTSSVAAYGFHEENPQPLTEEVAPKGTEEFYYPAQKAELERELHKMVDESDVEAYVFRPCIVAGPRAQSPRGAWDTDSRPRRAFRGISVAASEPPRKVESRHSRESDATRGPSAPEARRSG